MKLSYQESVNKHRVRDSLLSHVKQKQVIGLAGPNINEYVNYYAKKGISVLRSYERNRSIFIHQLSQSPNVDIVFGDIDDIKPESNILYDFDYCCSIKSVNLDLLRSTDNFLATFSLRPFGLNYTINTFNSNCKVFGADYKFQTYRDGGTPMLNILKIKK